MPALNCGKTLQIRVVRHIMEMRGMISAHLRSVLIAGVALGAAFFAFDCTAQQGASAIAPSSKAEEQKAKALAQSNDNLSFQALSIVSQVPRSNAVVSFKPGIEGAAISVCDAQDLSASPFPIYKDENGIVSFVLPDKLMKAEPRRVMATYAPKGDKRASQQLSARPLDGDEYALVQYGSSWNFNDAGDLKKIKMGNSASDYGKVTVEKGCLNIPVTGKDPYFVFGNMFNSDPATDEKIDSGIYTRLLLRTKQTCESGEWRVFVTEENGERRRHPFKISGTDFHELSIDLAKEFPQFWDGRRFRALRIDLPELPGTVAAIDYVYLVPPTPKVEAGPCLTEKSIRASVKVQTVQAELPAAMTAGSSATVKISCLDKDGKIVDDAPCLLELYQANNLLLSCFTQNGSVAFTAPQTAGSYTWRLGVYHMNGKLMKQIQGNCEIVPDKLQRIAVVPEKTLIRVDSPVAKLDVLGFDRFSNQLPVDIPRPQWHISGGIKAPQGPLRGKPASLSLELAAQPRISYDISLDDGAGHQASTKLYTYALKKNPITINRNGYFVHDGKLFLPLGGFYANWPSAQPASDGAIQRAIDLFPCGPVPYKYGYPWPPDVERKVADYLDLYKRNGVTALRLMLRNLDIAGDVDEVQLKGVLHLLDLGKARGIRFSIVLFEDYDKPVYGNKKILDTLVLPKYSKADLDQLPPHRAEFLIRQRLVDGAKLTQEERQRNPYPRYTDRNVIACQKDYLDALIPYLTDRDEILCYELENEMIHPPLSWVNEMSDYIRSIDPLTPVVGNPHPHDWPVPLAWRGSAVDVYNFHPYTDGEKYADHGAIVFMKSKWSMAAGKPMFTGEGGIQHRMASSGDQARTIRDLIWLPMACGASGSYMWTAFDLSELKEFGKVQAALSSLGVDLASMKRRRPDTCVVMPLSAGMNDASIKTGLMLLERGIDFDVAAKDSSAPYKLKLQPNAQAGQLPSESQFFTPSKGYQLAGFMSEDGNALIYLRNAAGGIKESSKCYVRSPQEVEASITLPGSFSAATVSAFDLDAVSTAQVSRERQRVLISPKSSHDYLIYVKGK